LNTPLYPVVLVERRFLFLDGIVLKTKSKNKREI
jgi:hypothetical protein